MQRLSGIIQLLCLNHPYQIRDANRKPFFVKLGARERWAFAVRTKYELCFDSVDALDFA